jgi:hypothetical protein
MMTEQEKSNRLVYGKDATPNVVCIEQHDGYAEVFQEVDGKVTSNFIESKHWLLSAKSHGSGFIRLEGDQNYKFGKQFKSRNEYFVAKSKLRNEDIYTIYDEKEMCMVNKGITFFKNTKIEDVSVLSFDIETTSLDPEADNAKLLLISTTYRNKQKTIKRLFAYDEYESEGQMIEDFCTYIRELDPSVILGHNIFCFDLPYIQSRADQAGVALLLGRDGSAAIQNKFESKFRKEATQFIHYKKFKVYGRELIDTLFLSIKHDIAARKYDSYGLKNIIKQEGLEKKDRVFYDANLIRVNYKNPVEWAKIKDYCCFAPKSSLVSLENGSTKFIEDMVVGDSVITHTGATSYVYDTIKRDYKGQLLSFNLEGGRKIIRVTPEHPFLVLNEETLQYEWKKAEHIKRNDLLVKGFKTPTGKNVLYKDDDVWLFGLYLGDGYVRKQKSLTYPVFTQHQNEVQNLINVLERNNYKFSVIQSKSRTNKAVQVVVFSNSLGQRFFEWSGGNFKSNEKRISKEMFEILLNSKRMFFNFLSGLLDADGHVRKLKKTYQTHICISSPHLVNTVDLLCSEHGLNVTRQNFRTRGKTKPNMINGREVLTKSTFYELTFFTESVKQINEYLKNKKRTDLKFVSDVESFKKHVRVLKIETQDYEGPVYNISVAGDNSYISNGIITHNCDDSDDALMLYDLMIPAFFALCTIVPKSFQAIIESASGSQLNSVMVRSYLQDRHSIPKESEVSKFPGALSNGQPGAYKNCVKLDISGLYPSIMLTYSIEDKTKDPKGNFLRILKILKDERIKNKALAKTTKDAYYDALQNSQKILVNSCYGFMGASGLNFNYPEGAAKITEYGREILRRSIYWATSKEYEEIWNIQERT